MKEEHDYSRDISEIRSMMERSSKFLSLSGWAGILAGLYALIGAWIAYAVFDFYPTDLIYTSPNLPQVIMLAVGILVLALASAIADPRRKAHNRGESIWNATSKRLLWAMAVPLFSGGLLIIILMSYELIGLVTPLTLIFYGLALCNAGQFTIKEVRFLGYAQLFLGLLNAVFIPAHRSYLK